ncbi:MAG: hypothetical protein FIA97_19145 [Methylococcaceae bacterium]|nr:hypothetical protein [Methylococcaceae bacterium]
MTDKAETLGSPPMDRETAKELFNACEAALISLTAAEHAIRRIPDGDERARLLRALGNVIADVLTTLRAPAVQQYPDIEPQEELGEPDTALTAEELELVSCLKPADLELIDQTLLMECAPTWRKVARIVGVSMLSLQGRTPSVPAGYYVRRVAQLVRTGELESQGNLDYMRFSEVRIPGSGNNLA